MCIHASIVQCLCTCMQCTYMHVHVCLHQVLELQYSDMQPTVFECVRQAGMFCAVAGGTDEGM